VIVEVAIQIVWWIGLAGALLLTLPIVQAVVLVVRALRDIRDLGHYIDEAARQMVTHLEVDAELASLLPPAGTIQAEAEQLAGTAARVKQRLAPVTGAEAEGR
jgi:hypothetical protein